MVKLWRCVICGDPYVGANPPNNCPFCGAHGEFILEAKEAVVTFEVPLSEKDRSHAEHALQVEVSNAAFYRCAAEKMMRSASCCSRLWEKLKGSTRLSGERFYAFPGYLR